MIVIHDNSIKNKSVATISSKPIKTYMIRKIINAIDK
jgi:hypothetical protein